LNAQKYIDQLNALKGKKGFVFENYSESGKAQRLYFSEQNGQKIDAVRTQIEIWKNENRVDENLYFFLLASLIESADKVANTASVYGAFLKKLKKSAQKPLVIEPAVFEVTANSH